MQIKYIGYYCTDEDTDAYISPAAVNKMTYIAECVNRMGHEVEIVSLSGRSRKRFDYGAKQVLENLLHVTYIHTLPRKNWVMRKLNNWWTNCGLFLYLLKTVTENDILLVYHSVALVQVWRKIQKIKKCKICLEVEEIYQDAQVLGARLREREYKAFEWANSYIFPTQILQKKIDGKQGKPFAIAHGSYKLPEKREPLFRDGAIHVVYAGTFNQKKGGVTSAIKAGEFLNEQYHLHIIGFGNHQEVKQVLQLIDETKEKSNCLITYDGCKMGEEYEKFIQSCQVGLSTQRSNNELNDTSFPSKILSYLSNDVNVVTVKIRVVEESAVGDIVYYYTKDEPQDIARVVEMAAQKSEKTGRKRLLELDKVFVQELERLLEKI